MNPDTEDDAVYQRFIAHSAGNVWLCPVNWSDNAFFSQELEADRLHCQRYDPHNYANIWEGAPRSSAQGSIYEQEMAALYAKARVCEVAVDAALPVHTVWDLGFSDETAIVFVQKTQTALHIVDYVEEKRRTLEWFARALHEKQYAYGTHWLPHDGARSSLQTGITPVQMLRQLGHKRVLSLKRGNVEDGIRAARSLFAHCFFDRQRCAPLLAALKTYRRSELRERATTAPRPIHDRASHGADAWRYLASCWRMMRNDEDYVYTESLAQDWRV